MPQQENYILECNLQSALYLAVQKLKEQEAKNGPEFCSSFRKGLEENLKGIREGRPLVIR